MASWNDSPLPFQASILDVDHSDGIVQRLPINRQPGMPRADHQIDDVFQARLGVDGDDIHARHHHVLGGTIAQTEDVGDEVVVGIERRFAFIAANHQCIEGVAGRSVTVA